jgi:DNA-binding MarR family transcriptional regulator
LFAGLQRWRYVTVEPSSGQPLRKPPQPDAVVRVTPAARVAQEIWRPLPVEVEKRWRARFGPDAVARLRHALGTVYTALPFDPPAYLPVVYPTQNGKADHLAPIVDPDGRIPPADLAALLSGVLLVFTVDFEAESRISLPISANTLRVLTEDGVRVRDLPAHTGVSKEANAMCVGWLERHGCAASVPEPGASRGKLVRLTEKGNRAQAKYRRILHETEQRWQNDYGADALHALRDALAAFVGDDGTLASSPLAQALEPAPGNWRARVRTPETLPHYPMVLHRGGYPDGS